MVNTVAAASAVSFLVASTLSISTLRVVLLFLLVSTCYLVFLLLPGEINAFELKLEVSTKQRTPGIDVLQARHSVSGLSWEIRPVACLC